MFRVPGVSIWVGLAVLWGWIVWSQVGGWPLLAAITLVVLARFAKVLRRSD
jgi:membrane protein implicated in regulation of membrane protease activity